MKTKRLLIALMLISGFFCCACSSVHQANISHPPGYYYCVYGDSIGSTPVIRPDFITSAPAEEETHSSKPEWTDCLFSKGYLLPIILLLFGNAH